MSQVVPYGSLVLGAVSAAIIAWFEGGGPFIVSLVVFPFVLSGSTLLALEVASKRARAKRRAKVIERRNVEQPGTPVAAETDQLDPGSPRVTETIGIPFGILTRGPFKDYRQDA